MTDYKEQIKLNPKSHASNLYHNFTIEKLVTGCLYYDGIPTLSEKNEMEKAIMARIQDLEEKIQDLEITESILKEMQESNLEIVRKYAKKRHELGEKRNE